MSVRQDVINLSINIGGNQAQAELTDLRKLAADLRVEMTGVKKGTQDYIDKTKELNQVNDRMAALKKQIGITSLTLKELRQEQTRLNSLFSSAVPFSKQYYDLEKQLKSVNARIYDVKNGVQGLASVWSRINDQVKQFGMLAAGYLGFQFLTSQFQSIIQGAGKMSDQLADLQRVAGLTTGEVNDLNRSLKEIDTRTSSGGLRDIAIIAGKLGVAKNDIFEFTKAVDMLVVSLGDELGDADQITTQLGKILNVFDGKITGDSITKLGNAFVELANTGAATGGFIADFDQRLSGIAKSAGISLGALSGLGAGLEEMGGRVESSSTAIQKLIIHIAADLPGAAKTAGMSLADFSKLFQEDGTEALLRYSEGLVKNKESFAEMTASLKDAGEEGARTIETITKLGTGADKLRGRIDLGKKSIQENAAITEAFSLKNETLGAELDKLGKEFNRLMTSPALTNFLKSAVENAREFIEWLKDLPNWLERNRTALIATTTIILLYNAAKIKAIALSVANKVALLFEIGVSKLEAAQLAISTFLTNAYAYAKKVLTGQITLATVAQEIWNAVTKQNPLVWVILLVGAAATAISKWTETIKVNTDAQKNNAAIQADANTQTRATKNEVESLTRVLQSSTASVEEKTMAMTRLKAAGDGYLDGLTQENITQKEGINIIKDYISWLDQLALAKARVNLKAKLMQDQLEAENKALTLQADYKGELANSKPITGTFSALISSTKLALGFGDQDALQALKKVQEADKTTKEIASRVKTLSESTAAIVESYRKNIADETAKLATLKQGSAEALALSAQIEKNQKLLFATEGLSPEEGKTAGNGQTNTNTTNKAAVGAAKSTYDQLKKEAAQFALDMEKLQWEINNNGKTVDEQEVARIQQKYADLLAKAKKYSYDAMKIKGMEQQELDALMKKRWDQSVQDEYNKSIAQTERVYNDDRTRAGQQYAAGLIDKKTYTAKLKQLDLDEKDSLVRTATDYVGHAKTAADDLLKYQADAEKAHTQAAIEGKDEREALTDEETIARAKREVLLAKDGSTAQLEAKKNLLQVQFDLETAAMDKKSEMYKLKEAELQKSLQELDDQTWKGKLQHIFDFIEKYSAALTSLNQILSNRETRSLQKDKADNEAKKNLYQQQLNSKLISQAQYDLKIQGMDEALDAKSKEIAQRQAKRDKAIALFAAVINTAKAVTEALPNFFLAGLAGLLGGLQIAAIASQPLPEMGLGDWVREGNTHAQGGINANIEKNEAVIRAKAMTDPNTYTVTGTTAQITSKLNSINGGVAWSQGASLMPAWRSNSSANLRSDLPSVLKANGFGGNASNSTDTSVMESLMAQMVRKQEEIIEEQKKMKTKLHAVVSIKEFRKEEKKYDDAKKSSSLKQD